MSITFGLRTASSARPQVDPFGGDLVLTLQALSSKRSIMEFSVGAARSMELYTPDSVGNFHNVSVSTAQDTDGNFFIFVNDGDNPTISQAQRVKVSKSFTFSDKATYQAIVEKFNLNTENDNHISLVPTEVEALPGVTLYEMVSTYQQNNVEEENQTLSPMMAESLNTQEL